MVGPVNTICQLIFTSWFAVIIGCALIEGYLVVPIFK